MKKSSYEKLARMIAADMQYVYGQYLADRDPETFTLYVGMCDMIDHIGGMWRRDYKGDRSAAQRSDIANYSHWVMLPDEKTIEGWEI